MRRALTVAALVIVLGLGTFSANAVAVVEGSEGIPDGSGSGVVCLLAHRIEQQPGLRIMDAVGRIGSCFPDSQPFIRSWIKACIVETRSSGWREVSCTSWRTQLGYPPHYSHHAGWHCTVGVYYRARIYGMFVTVTEQGPPGANIVTSPHGERCN